MPKHIAVILSGCGVYDGSEIQEAVFTLLALDQAGASYQCCAPDKPQLEVIDHTTGTAADEHRNCLTEAARIARGNIVALKDIRASDYDAVILPGGFGAAKNLCTYARDGRQANVDPEVLRVLKDFHGAGKPIGAWCIAPMAVARAFGKMSPVVTLTIGNDEASAADLESFGAAHKAAGVTEFVTDGANRIVTTPAYMYGDASPAQIYEGIQKATNGVISLLG